MNVISRKKIFEFIKKHADVKNALLSWYKEASNAVWTKPQDIKSFYPSASFLGKNIVIFNIKGNKYRLAVKVNYTNKIIFIKWIGTHAQYGRKRFEEGT